MPRKQNRKQGARLRAHYLARRVAAFLRDNEEGYRIYLVRIYNNKQFCEKHRMTIDTYGFIDPESCTIFADYRYDVLRTIIHEVFHALYPNAIEDEIRSKERLVMRHLTENQAVAIWAYAAQCM